MIMTFILAIFLTLFLFWLFLAVLFIPKNFSLKGNAVFIPLKIYYKTKFFGDLKISLPMSYRIKIDTNIINSYNCNGNSLGILMVKGDK